MRGIYKIINVVNNNFYVGSAVNFKKRKAKHFYALKKGVHSNGHLQAAWNKYGENAFIFAVVQEVSAEEDLLAAENVWLHEHVGKDYCYNLGTDATAPLLGIKGSAHPMFGFTHTEETKRKIGEHSKNQIQSDETKAKRIATMTGQTYSLERRINLSKAISGDKNPNYGKPRSDEFKEKVSKAIVAAMPMGAIIEFPSITALREALGLKPSTVNNALKHGKALRMGSCKGWSFFYKENYNYDIAFPDGKGPR